MGRRRNQHMKQRPTDKTKLSSNGLSQNVLRANAVETPLGRTFERRFWEGLSLRRCGHYGHGGAFDVVYASYMRNLYALHAYTIYMRWMMVPVPRPPPQHMVTRAFVFPVRSSS